MKCPFELPAKKEVTHVTEVGVKYKVFVGKLAIAAFLSKEQANYIVQAINSYAEPTITMQCPACGEDVPIYEFGFTDCQCGGMRFELTVNAEPIEEKEQ